MEIDEIVQLLEEIAPTVSDWHNVGTALRKQGLESREHPLWKYVFAFEYMYVEETQKDYFERYGVFAPWIEMQGDVFPPPLSVIENESLAEWASALEKAEHPVLCSRLADLLWIKRWGERPDLYARQSIDSYLEISTGEWVEMERTYCLMRALDLSREIKDNERKAKTISLIIHNCHQELKSEDPKPGVSLRLIQALMKLPKAEIPSEIDGLLDLVVDRYTDNAWAIENALSLMMKRADAKKQKELELHQISRWVEEADKSEKGIAQMAHLEHALEIARNYGVQNVADEIRKKIQSIPEEDFQLKTVSAQVKIPTEVVEGYLNWFVHENGWKESFSRFGFREPPSGDHNHNIEEIEKQVKDFPMQFLVTRVVQDDNNLPICFGRTTDENKKIALAQYESMRIRMFGTLAPTILYRIHQKHGLPSQEELSEFFTTPIIPTDISENIAKAIIWYFKGEFDVAAHLLVPRIESVIRILTRELGLSIMREPVGNIPGGVLQLGSLLVALEGKLEESWRRYLHNLLAEPIGINLRNRICHGLVTKVGQEDAALLIHAVCYLRLIRVSTIEEAEKMKQ